MQFLRTLFPPPRVQWIALHSVLFFLLFAVLWKGGKSLETTWLLVVLAFICIWQYWYCRSGSEHKLPLGLWCLAIEFLLITALSYVVSTTKNYGLDEVLRTAALMLLFLWSARTLGAQSEFGIRSKNAVLRMLVYAAIFACVLGCFVYVLQPVNRFTGSIFDFRFHTDYWPNAWAQFLLLAWPIAVWWAQGHRKKLLVLGFMLGCFFLSYSRGAYIAFIDQVVLWAVLLLWLRIPRNAWKAIIHKGIPIALVAAITFWGLNGIRTNFYDVQSLEQKVTFTADEGTSSASERQQFWSQAYELMQMRPLFGWGPYSFRFVQPRLQEEVLATSDHPHNVFLKIAMERGLIAFMLFLGLILAIAYGVLTRIVRRTDIDIDFADPTLPILVATAGVLAHNLIDYNLQFVGIALPFWLLLGVLASLIYTAEVRTPSMRTLMSWSEIVLVTMLLLLAITEAHFLVVSSVGRHAEARGDTRAALYWYDIARDQMFSRDLHLSRAKLLLESNRFEEAENALEYYRAQNKEDPRALRLMAETCKMKRDWVCVLESYEQAYEWNKYNDIGITRAYVDFLRSIGRKGEIDNRRREFEQLMNQYHLAILQNTHFIALSPNVEEITALANVFTELYPEDEPQYAVLAATMERKGRDERKAIQARPPGYLW